jgi:hypothetical protein
MLQLLQKVGQFCSCAPAPAELLLCQKLIDTHYQSKSNTEREPTKVNYPCKPFSKFFVAVQYPRKPKSNISQLLSFPILLKTADPFIPLSAIICRL